MIRRLLFPLDWTLSLIGSVLRLGAGGPGKPAVTPEKPLILYEFENCPFCRIAREAISVTGVPVEVRPCPKGGARYRPRAIELGGKSMFPYLIDPNTDVAMYESADIARYVRETYAPDAKPFMHRLGPLNLLTSIALVWPRLMRGMMVRPSRQPDQRLEFQGAENSPAARIIREALSTHELAYLWTSHTDGAGLKLKDPNTGETQTGALSILTYLDRTYCQPMTA